MVQTEGSRQVAREIDFYNLDAVISVGYRVNSHRATQFRIWATKVKCHKYIDKNKMVVYNGVVEEKKYFVDAILA